MNDDQSVVTNIISTVGGQILFYTFMMLSNWMMLAILTSAPGLLWILLDA